RALPGSDTPAIPLRTDGSVRLADIARSSEAQAILDTLDACSGNRGATARKLGISERTLRYRMADMREAGLLAAGGAR
ncbi:MAG: helix-turn-helix domain-containing protein, partial [Alteripontixanthobacter sp.]